MNEGLPPTQLNVYLPVLADIAVFGILTVYVQPLGLELFSKVCKTPLKLEKL